MLVPITSPRLGPANYNTALNLVLDLFTPGQPFVVEFQQLTHLDQITPYAVLAII